MDSSFNSACQAIKYFTYYPNYYKCSEHTFLSFIVVGDNY